MPVFNNIINFIDDDIVHPIEKAAKWVESTKPIQYIENIGKTTYNLSLAAENASSALANESGQFVRKTAQSIEKTEENISDSFKYLPYIAGIGILIYLLK